MSTCILWFRNNLRLSDNFPVAHAYANYDRVIPVYLWEHPSEELDRWGNEAMGAFRRAFLQESLEDLQEKLQEHDSDLLVVENAEGKLVELAKHFGAKAIIGPSEMAYNEKKEEGALQDMAKNAGIQVKFFLERTLYSQKELPFSLEQLPDVFTKFRKLVEKRSRVEFTIEEPEISPIGDVQGVVNTDWKVAPVDQDARTAVPFNGGSSAAWSQLDYYIWEKEFILEYKQTRNGLVGRDYSSKFSAYLALGCISAREIYEEVQRFEEQVEANESTYWLFFELLWREYFQWIALLHGKDLFLPHGLQKEKPLKGGFNPKAFERWKNGNTGDAFVDANMKELAATGFMSNRGRQNVASYLVHDMGLDWRPGAAYFESQLIDYDPASNYGNWLYNAGRGNDPRPFRKFNTKFQAERYDPEGTFVRQWS